MSIIKNVSLLILLFYFCSEGYAQNSPAKLKPFSDSVTRGGLVFVSGQIGSNALSAVDHSFSDEVKAAIENVSQILKKSNLSLKDVISVSVYLKNIKDLDTFNAIYMAYFSHPFPVRTCVAVKDLVLNANVEITVVAGKK